MKLCKYNSLQEIHSAYFITTPATRTFKKKIKLFRDFYDNAKYGVDVYPLSAILDTIADGLLSEYEMTKIENDTLLEVYYHEKSDIYFGGRLGNYSYYRSNNCLNGPNNVYIGLILVDSIEAYYHMSLTEFVRSLDSIGDMTDFMNLVSEEICRIYKQSTAFGWYAFYSCYIGSTSKINLRQFDIKGVTLVNWGKSRYKFTLVEDIILTVYDHFNSRSRVIRGYGWSLYVTEDIMLKVCDMYRTDLIKFTQQRMTHLEKVIEFRKEKLKKLESELEVTTTLYKKSEEVINERFNNFTIWKKP